MAYGLEEQEQIDAIKGWWNDYGKLVMLAVIGALIAIAALQGWRYYRAQQSERAATLYAQLETAAQAKEHKKVRDIAGQLIQSYGSTQYAGMAALASAKASFETGEIDEARRNLQWAMDKAREEEMRHVARLRLAGILLDEKRYDEALKLLSTEPPQAYAAIYADLRGDVLAAQGKPAEAREAYRVALEKGDVNSQYRRLIEIKQDALGGAK